MLVACDKSVVHMQGFTAGVTRVIAFSLLTPLASPTARPNVRDAR